MIRSAFLCMVVLALASPARGDQCHFGNDKVLAYMRSAVKLGDTVLVHCQPCRVAVPDVVVVETLELVGDELEINGDDHDLAYLYVPAGGGWFRNVARATGCHASGVDTFIKWDPVAKTLEPGDDWSDTYSLRSRRRDPAPADAIPRITLTRTGPGTYDVGMRPAASPPLTGRGVRSHDQLAVTMDGPTGTCDFKFVRTDDGITVWGKSTCPEVYSYADYTSADDHSGVEFAVTDGEVTAYPFTMDACFRAIHPPPDAPPQVLSWAFDLTPEGRVRHHHLTSGTVTEALGKCLAPNLQQLVFKHDPATTTSLTFTLTLTAGPGP